MKKHSFGKVLSLVLRRVFASLIPQNMKNYIIPDDKEDCFISLNNLR